MKRLSLYFLLIIIFFTSTILCINIFSKVSINSKLILGRNFYAEIEYTSDSPDTADIDVVFRGVQTLNSTERIIYHGCLGKLYRYENYWVGKISSYKGDSCRTDYFRDVYSIYDKNNPEDLALIMKMDEDQNKYSGYFIINDNIEKMGLTEKEVLTYLKIKSIKNLKFKKAEYYIEKYGDEIILTPDYVIKNRHNDEIGERNKTIEEFEKEKKTNIINCIFIIVVGIIGVIGIKAR